MAKEPVAGRHALPIQNPPHRGLITFDAADPATKFAPIEAIRPPEGSPNVLIVMLDDAGFGSSSAFGGPCNTPNAERLAAQGLKFNRFHTTALCSPTRQALLTGRNHHAVGMGGITEIATSAPGYSSVRPIDAAPLAEMMLLNGFSTAQFGKCHEVPVWETSPMGPFRQWPTGSGFEYFYGFLGGETNQWYPALYEGTTPVEPPKTPEEGYHFTDDMTDKAISWVRQQKSLMPDKPFIMYYAPGGTHAPHHVATEWSDKYKGKFDQGWDAVREETLARQKALGVVPPDTELSARHEEIPAWDDMPDDMKPLLARQMEVYAGFMVHTDHNVGRLIDTLEALEILEILEILDDTLVYYIIGDNGASAEGSPNGTFNEFFVFNGASEFESVESMEARIDEFGTPTSYNHYAVGWAHAMDTPYQWTKQVASHFGGTRNGTIVHWPNGIEAKGELRSQFCHVIDVAATILDAVGVNAGLYAFRREVIDTIPTGRPVSVERETFPGLLEAGAVVRGHVFDGYWRDFGTPADFVTGSADLVRGIAPSPAVPTTGERLVLSGASVADDALVDGGTTVGAGAVVGARARVESSVLFDGARIAAGAVVRRSVIGRGASIGAGSVLEDVIVGDGAVVGAGVELLHGVRVWPGAELADGSVRFSSDL